MCLRYLEGPCYERTRRHTKSLCLQRTRWLNHFLKSNARDPFSRQLLSGADEELINPYYLNATAFAGDTLALASNTVAQLVDTMAHQSDHTRMVGSIILQVPRLFLRQWALRLAQASLTVLAIICGLLVTVARIESCLQEDCGTLASLSVTLANSTDLEQVTVKTLPSNQNDLGLLCHDADTHTNRDEGGFVVIQSTIPRGHLRTSAKSASAGGHFRPTSLHWLYVRSIVLFTIELLVAIATTLRWAIGDFSVSN